jgi:hypothetical protein
LGAFYWANYIQEQTTKAKVYTIADSGLFPPFLNPITNQTNPDRLL